MKADPFQEIINAKIDGDNRTAIVRSQLVQLSLALRDLRASLLLCDLGDQLAEDSHCQTLFLEGLAHLELSRLAVKRAALSLDD